MYIVCYDNGTNAFVEVTADPLNTHARFVDPAVLAKVDLGGYYKGSDFMVIKEGVWNKNGS